MLHTLRAALVGVLLAGTAPLLGQPDETAKRIDHGKTDPKLKGITTPNGFKLEIVATPAMTNPVGLAWASDGGLLFVREPARIGDGVKKDGLTLTYQDKSTRKIDIRNRTGKDVVRSLSDPTGKDVWEAAQSEVPDGLNAVLSHDGWLYEARPGLLRRLKGDKVETVLQGFGDVPHGVTGLVVGPDGWLYVSVGAGDHFIEGSDGGKLTLLGTGGVLRCRPDGAKVHVVARGFVQPTAPTWDSVGQAFIADREPRGGRIMHLLDGNDHGYRLSVARTSPVTEEIRKEFFEPLFNPTPTMLKTAGSTPTAVLAPIEARFPGHFRALLLVADASKHAVSALSLDAEGATYVVGKALDFIASSDPAFTPVDLKVGPDGALYILDARPEPRLLRMTWAGIDPEDALPRRPMDSWKKLLKGSDEDLILALSTPEAGDRRIAADELTRRDKTNVPALIKLVNDREESLLARLAALNAALGLWDKDVRVLCFYLLTSTDNDLRRLAVEALGLNCVPKDEPIHAALVKAIQDSDPRVKRASAIALGRIGNDAAPDVLVSTLVFDDGRDLACRVGLTHGIELLGRPGVDRLLSVGDSGVDAEIAKIVAAFAGLQTVAATEALPKLLVNPHLNAAQRSHLVRTLPRYRLDPPLSLDFLSGHFDAMPDEPPVVKLAALEAILLGTGPIQTEKLGSLLVKLLKDRDENVRLTALRCVPTIRPAKVGEVLDEIVSEKTHPTAERLAALRALASVDGKAAKTVFAAQSEETRTKWLAELKKQADAADLVRDLEK